MLAEYDDLMAQFEVLSQKLIDGQHHNYLTDVARIRDKVEALFKPADCDHETHADTQAQLDSAVQQSL